MEQKSIKKSHGSVYNLNYHLVWVVKRRKPFLVGNIAEDLKTLIRDRATNMGVTIESFEVMPDHVHLFVSSPPKLSPHQLVKRFKGAASKKLRNKYPQLLRIPALWSGSYYVGSVGFMSESVVRNYIENQKGI